MAQLGFRAHTVTSRGHRKQVTGFLASTAEAGARHISKTACSRFPKHRKGDVLPSQVSAALVYRLPCYLLNISLEVDSTF